MTSASSDETQLLDQQLCFAVYAASLALTRRYQPLLGELGLTYPQYIALMALWEEDGIRRKPILLKTSIACIFREILNFI